MKVSHGSAPDMLEAMRLEGLFGGQKDYFVHVFGNNVELPLVSNSLKMKDFLIYRSRLCERSVQEKYWPARSRQLGLSCFREFLSARHKGQHFPHTERAKEEYLLYGQDFSNMKEALSKLY